MRFGFIIMLVAFLFTSGFCETQNPKIDYFSSTVMASQLVDTHDQVIKLFTKYMKAIEEAGSLLHRYLSANGVSYVAHPWATDGDPLRTYHLIKRTSIDIGHITETIRNLRSLDPLLEMDNFRDKGLLPDDSDFHGVARSLVRLQKVYKLDPNKLVQGQLRDGLNLPVTLAATDCLFLGQMAEIQQNMQSTGFMLAEAAMWYQAGLTQISDDPVEANLKQELNTELERVRLQIQEMAASNVDVTETRLSPPLLDPSLSWDQILFNYRRLCRGEKLRPPSLDRKNLCHLSHGPHPYMKLRPLKVEVLSRNPYLVILHDIIGEGEIQQLKEEALPVMERSSHLGDDDIGAQKSDLRVSVTSWITDGSIPTLTARLQALTGMAANSSLYEAEQYQVLNYGVGGHYTPHFDYFETLINDVIMAASGDRIATLMIYLSDVEAGGATAFPYLGLSLFPKKGSAAFWWNLKSSGVGDPLTTHGACPVLYGTKWVSNKWFRYEPQMFRVPCGLRPNITLRHL